MLKASLLTFIFCRNDHLSFFKLAELHSPVINVLEHKSDQTCTGLTSLLISVNDGNIAIFCLTDMGKMGKAADNGPNADEGSSSDCLPCQQGCAFCKDDTPCVAREDGALRMAVLSFQCLCLLIVFVSMVLIYHFRRNKVGIIISITLHTKFDLLIII